MAYEAKFVKTGNIKTGRDIWTFNKLAGNSIIGSCKGTCGNHCTGCWNTEDPKHSPCYVRKAYVQYGWDNGTVVKAHIRNTNIMRNDMNKAFDELNMQLKKAKKKPVAVRLHSAGELESAAELMAWFRLAAKYPDIPFYVYTKAYDILNETLAKNTIPKNFYINVSIWHENGIECYNRWKQLDNVRCFIYNDNKYDYKAAGLEIGTKCPAYDDKGKMNHNMPCSKCGICYQTKAKVCSCIDH